MEADYWVKEMSIQGTLSQGISWDLLSYQFFPLACQETFIKFMLELYSLLCNNLTDREANDNVCI